MENLIILKDKSYTNFQKSLYWKESRDSFLIYNDHWLVLPNQKLYGVLVVKDFNVLRIAFVDPLQWAVSFMTRAYTVMCKVYVIAYI